MSVQQFRFTHDAVSPIFLASTFHPLATVIGQELDRIGGAEGGTYTVNDVVAHARDAASPLHQFFEWDDAAAATKYRHDQGMAVIHSVVRLPSGENRDDVVQGILDDEPDQVKGDD